MMTSTFGSGSVKKLPGWKRTRDGELMFFHVLLENRCNFGKIESCAGEMRILECDLHDEITLRGAAIGSGLVFAPGKFRGDRHVCSAADAGHGAQKAFEARGIGIESGEWFFFTSGFVLVFAGPDRGGQVSPMMVEPLIGHLQHSPDIRRFALVEEDVAGWRIAVVSIFPFQKAESNESIKEVARGTGMQAESAGQRFETLRAFGKFGEDFHFNGAEESFRGPEGKAGLQNVVG